MFSIPFYIGLAIFNNYKIENKVIVSFFVGLIFIPTLLSTLKWVNTDVFFSWLFIAGLMSASILSIDKKVLS